MAIWLPVIIAVTILPLAVWVHFDARRSGGAPTAAALLTLVLGPLGFALYLGAKTATTPGSPVAARLAVFGAVGVGLLSLVIGLVVGLSVHARTAPFAAIELGLPGGALGAICGATVGLSVTLYRRIAGAHH